MIAVSDSAFLEVSDLRYSPSENNFSTTKYLSERVNIYSNTDQVLYMLWFNFILGSNFIFRRCKLIIIHYHYPKAKANKDKIEPQHV